MQTSANSVNIREYFKILRSRFWVIFTIFLLTVVSGAYVTEEVLPKSYSADAQIQIRPRGEVSVPGQQSNMTDRVFDPTAFQAEFEIMQSSKILGPVIADLQLDKRWAKTVFNIPSLTQQQALGRLGQLVKVESKRGTDIVDITVSDIDPKEAAEIANSVADHYKASRDNEESERSGQGTDTIRAQIKDQEALVADRRVKLDQIRADAFKDGITIDPRSSGQTSATDSDLEKDKSDLLAAQEDADARNVLYTSMQKLDDEQFVNTLTAMGRIDKNIGDIRSQLLELKSERDKLIQQGFGENNASVLSNNAEQETKEAQIKDLIQGQRQALALDVQMATSRVGLLQNEVKELTAKALAEQGAGLGAFRDAQRDWDKQQAILDTLRLHLQTDMNDAALMESPVRIISRATPPEVPSKPNSTLNLIISILAGLFLGVLIAFLVEYLDTSVKTMADAESLLGLPVLTVIPNKGGPLPLNAQSARLPHAEGYRILRAKLDLKVQNGIGPSLSMLSGGPGEGKSTTIYNLAVICAQAGQSVILVDGDLRRPRLHELVDLPNDHGLADYFRGESTILDHIQQTALPNLHVLTAGEVEANEIGAVLSEKIRRMLDELKQRYDVVLVDSPPVLGISDGTIIAREIDYVILVIQHRRYPREISLRAKRAIEEAHGNCVGMVLNCVAIKSDDSYYYYSNYGNYYNDKGTRKKKKKKSGEEAVKTPVATNGKHATVATVRKGNLDSDEF